MAALNSSSLKLSTYSMNDFLKSENIRIDMLQIAFFTSVHAFWAILRRSRCISVLMTNLYQDLSLNDEFLNLLVFNF